MNGALLFEGKQRVSPFYHDLGLDLVGLIGNFLLVEQLLSQVVEQLLNPILSSNHVTSRSLCSLFIGSTDEKKTVCLLLKF